MSSGKHNVMISHLAILLAYSPGGSMHFSTTVRRTDILLIIIIIVIIIIIIIRLHYI